MNKGHLEIVDLLLKYGANVEADKGEPLRVAVEKGNIKIVNLLLKNRASVGADTGVLYVAVEKDFTEIARILLENGAEINEENENIVGRAIALRQLEMTKILFLYSNSHEKISPVLLSSLLLKMSRIERPRNLPRINQQADKHIYAKKSEHLLKLRRKLFSEIMIFLFHIYYRPGGRGFYQAIAGEL